MRGEREKGRKRENVAPERGENRIKDQDWFEEKEKKRATHT
jgi:hypothetical protein